MLRYAFRQIVIRSGLNFISTDIFWKVGGFP